MNGLRGQVAIVTGASSGIGQGIAIRLAQEGSNVVINYDSHREGAEETLKAVEEIGVKSLLVQADVSNVQEVQSLVDQSWQHFGSANMLVNNAGIEAKSDFLTTSEKDYDRILDVNLKGPFFMTQAFVKKLTAARMKGKIVNTSSVHEDMAFPGFASYCASKGGLRMLMRNLAVELGPHGITVNNVAPGAIATPMNKSLLENKAKLDAVLSQIPLGRLGTMRDVAGLVAFLLSDEASYITGSTFVIDGGLIRNYHE